MAALLAILRALWRALRRDLGTLASIKVNNLFLFVALLAYGALNSGQPPKSAEPFFLLLGLLMLFPLSSDPLTRIPPSRLAVWPLARWQRFALRLASLALSPVAWIAVFVLFKTAQPALALALIAFALAVQFAAAPHWNLLRHIPRIPGRLGGLVRMNLREMLSLLDPYAALLLSIGGAAYRVFGRSPDPEAFSIIGLLVALALSTYAQSLFGLDFGSGITRYRLLPLRGWEILLAKDIAFLVILFVLLLPLDPAPGMTFGLAALAIGHHSSVLLHLPQQRWRFTGGASCPSELSKRWEEWRSDFLEMRDGVVVLSLTGLCYLASLYYYGRRWDRIV